MAHEAIVALVVATQKAEAAAAVDPQTIASAAYAPQWVEAIPDFAALLLVANCRAWQHPSPSEWPLACLHGLHIGINAVIAWVRIETGRRTSVYVARHRMPQLASRSPGHHGQRLRCHTSESPNFEGSLRA